MFLTRAKASVDDGDRSPFGNFWFGPVPSAGGISSTDDALRLTAVYRCVRLLSDTVSMLPFVLWRRVNDKKRVRVTDHWMYRLFALTPNQFNSPVNFRKTAQAHLELRGNAYSQIISGRRGEISALMPIHPDQIKIELLAGGNWRYRVKNRDGSVTILAREQVFHRKDFSLDGIIGLNPIEVARDSLDTGIAAQDYGRRFFQNDAKPGGVIETNAQFKDDQARLNFRNKWQQLLGGRNQNKLAVLEAGMKYTPIQINNTDAQFIESRKYTVSEIARLFGVPPHKIGDLERSTNNNIEQQSLDYINDALLTRIVGWESDIRFALLGDTEPDLEIELDTKALLRGDSTARANYLSKAVGGPWLTRNEARVDEGRNALEGLDEPLRPVNMTEESEVDPDDPNAEPPATAQQPAAPGAPAEQPKQQDARLAAMNAAAIDRIARKEMQLRAKAAGNFEALRDAYSKHVDFVAQVLVVPVDAANDYCTHQLAMSTGFADEASADQQTRARLACLVE